MLAKAILRSTVQTLGLQALKKPPRRLIFSKIFKYFGSSSDIDEKESARIDVKDAVRELSRGISSKRINGDGPSSGASIQPAATLRDWDKRDIQSLSVDQLSELARAHFDGNFGEGETRDAPNVTRSVQLWEQILTLDRENVEAAYSLASCYQSGTGVVKDPKRAFAMMKQLAEDKDYHLAHYAVAVMYASNNGVPPHKNNEKNAFTHFRAAAKHGVQPALFNIGNCFASGKGVKKSDANAAQYYSAGAEAGDPSAQFTLGTWLVQGRGGLTKDVERAFQLQCEAGRAGHSAAMFNAGCHLMTGQGCERDVALAAEWFQKAVDTGNIPEACINLGHLYRAGHGVDKDLIKARNLYARHSMVHQTSRAMLHQVEEEIKAGR